MNSPAKLFPAFFLLHYTSYIDRTHLSWIGTKILHDLQFHRLYPARKSLLLKPFSNEDAIEIHEASKIGNQCLMPYDLIWRFKKWDFLQSQPGRLESPHRSETPAVCTIETAKLDAILSEERNHAGSIFLYSLNPYL